MRLSQILAWVIASMIAVPVCAMDNNVTVGHSTDSAVLDTSSADACEPTLTEHFTRYLIQTPLLPNSSKHMLIKQDFEVGKGCFESYNPARVTLTANAIDIKTGIVDPNVVWSFETEGISGVQELWDVARLYRIDMPGCCAAEKTSKYYSLDTGNLVGSSTASPLEIDFPGVEKHYAFNDRRYLMVESNVASSPQGTHGAIATIFYGDARGMKDAISVFSADKEDWMVGSLDFERSHRETLLADSDKTKLHIHLQCRCDSAIDIIMPVTPDGLGINAAVIKNAEGIVIKEIPTPGQRTSHGQ